MPSSISNRAKIIAIVPSVCGLSVGAGSAYFTVMVGCSLPITLITTGGTCIAVTIVAGIITARVNPRPSSGDVELAVTTNSGAPPTYDVAATVPPPYEIAIQQHDYYDPRIFWSTQRSGRDQENSASCLTRLKQLCFGG